MRSTLIASQIYKVAQNVRVQGSSFLFARPRENEFGEPTAGSTPIEVQGLYHTTGGYVTSNGADGSTTRAKRSPMVLALIEGGKTIQTGDTLSYKGRNYKVTEVQDICELGICAEISLEEVQGNGKSNN